MKKVNFKLVNILLLLLIIVLAIFVLPNISGVLGKAFYALLPLIIAFALAYILNPLINLLQKYKIPRWLGILIVYTIVTVFFVYLVWGVLKPAVDSIGNISVGIENIMVQIGEILNVDTTSMSNYIIGLVDEIIVEITNFFTASGGTVGDVWNTLISGAVVIVVGIIFLLNFPRIRQRIKEYLTITVKPKTVSFVGTLDRELTNYLVAEIIIAAIQALEYGTLMLVLSIFFPEFLVFVPLVALVAAVLSLIPYFGGYFSILFTAIIVMTVPNAAYGMIAIGIFMLIFPQLDAYVINPKIYQTKLNLNPISTIAFVLLGQAFFGIVGAILSVPFQVVLEVTMQYYKDNIKSGIKKINEHL